MSTRDAYNVMMDNPDRWYSIEEIMDLSSVNRSSADKFLNTCIKAGYVERRKRMRICEGDWFGIRQYRCKRFAYEYRWIQ